jgi:hypothetical protein
MADSRCVIYLPLVIDHLSLALRSVLHPATLLSQDITMHIYKSNYSSVPITDESIVEFLLALPVSPARRSSVDSVTGETKTRGQVFDEALSLARGLILRKHAKPGQVALILGKTSVDYPVVALGCMAAGLIPSLASAAW